MDNIDNIIKDLNRCLLPRLAKNYDEPGYHPEFEIRLNTLQQNIQHLKQVLVTLDIKTTKAAVVISALLILYLELKSGSEWNNDKCKEMSIKINSDFALINGVSLDQILFKSTEIEVATIQLIFDISIESLHKKLTHSDFKKYPGQIDAYCLLVKNLKDCSVDIKVPLVTPASLVLMDDYNDIYKKKGLECCLSILQCLTFNDFKNGNYYEVIYKSLSKLLCEKDIEIMKLTKYCLLELCRSFPPEVKDKNLDDLFSKVLDQISIDSNLYRKAECLNFLTNILQINKTNSVKRSSFKTIICDCLDVCTESAVSQILMEQTLKCLKVWIQHCWCVWNFSSDHKMISILFKNLYVCEDEKLLKTIENIILTLCNLCSRKEQQQIYETIQENYRVLPEGFTKSLDVIKNGLNI